MLHRIIYSIDKLPKQWRGGAPSFKTLTQSVINKRVRAPRRGLIKLQKLITDVLCHPLQTTTIKSKLFQRGTR